MADLEKLSKFLAYVLRHNPQEANLTLDDQGFTPVDDLWAAVNKRFPGRYTWPDLLAIVEGDKTGKKRYEIDDRHIRALYGHNVAITEIAYEPAVPPEFIFHGTNEKALKQIKVEGLKSLGRQYVHCTTSLERALTVAGRRTSSDKIVMLKILALDAHNAGIVFYHPEPEHYLVKEVPPAFIRFPS
jgi:putative RNA 2'-phosphotransferase